MTLHAWIRADPHSVVEVRVVSRGRCVGAETTRRSAPVPPELLVTPGWEGHAHPGQGGLAPCPPLDCVTPTPVVRMRNATLALTTLAMLDPFALAPEATVEMLL